MKLNTIQYNTTHLLCYLKEVKHNEDTGVTMLLIDTTRWRLYEVDFPDVVSKPNEGEVNIAAEHVRQLLASGVKSKPITIIAP